jgi:hypothetical protein
MIVAILRVKVFRGHSHGGSVRRHASHLGGSSRGDNRAAVSQVALRMVTLLGDRAQGSVIRL